MAAGIALSSQLDENGELGAPYSTEAAPITVDCTNDATVEPDDSIVNVATITSFASIVGGSNFVDPGDLSRYQDPATARVGLPTTNKVIESVSPEGTGAGSVTSGDVVTEIRAGMDTLIYSADGAYGGNAGNDATISVSAPRYVRPGLGTSVGLRYKNASDTPHATMRVPEDMSFVSAAPTPSSIVGRELTWSGLTKLSGAIKVQVMVAAELLPGTTLTVTGTVTDSRGTFGDSAGTVVREGATVALPTSPSPRPIPRHWWSRAACGGCCRRRPRPRSP